MPLAACNDEHTPSRGETSARFMALIKAKHNNVLPFSGMSHKNPAPHLEQKNKTKGAEADLNNVIRVAFTEQKRLISVHGLAEAQNGQLSALFNPSEDGLMFAAAMTIPNFGFMASGVAMLSLKNYYQADRKKKKGKQNPLNTEFGYFSSPTLQDYQTRWDQPGFHSLRHVNDEKSAPLTAEQKDKITRPLKDDPDMRALLGQQANVKNARLNLKIREYLGIQPNKKTAYAALQKGETSFLYQENTPIPAPSA